MDVEGGLLLAGLAAGAALFRRWILRRASVEEDRTWAEAARRVGGELIPAPRSFFASGAPSIRWTTGGVELVAEVLQRWNGREREVTTRVRCALRTAPSWSVEVAPRGLLRQATRRLGVAAPSTGDAPFDDAFTLDAEPACLGVEYLDAATRREIQAVGEAFRIEAGVLTIEVEGRPGGEEPLVAMLRYGAHLAARWAALLDGPHVAAARLGLALVADAPLGDREVVVARGERRSHALTLALRVGPDLVTTVVFAKVRSSPWTFEPGAADAAVPEAARAIAVAPPAGLLGVRQTEEDAEIVFEGPSPDPAAVVDAVDLVLDAATRAGVYR